MPQDLGLSWYSLPAMVVATITSVSPYTWQQHNSGCQLSLWLYILAVHSQVSCKFSVWLYILSLAVSSQFGCTFWLYILSLAVSSQVGCTFSVWLYVLAVHSHSGCTFWVYILILAVHSGCTFSFWLYILVVSLQAVYLSSCVLDFGSHLLHLRWRHWCTACTPSSETM